MTDRYRVGLVVPSSNTTVETELPELLGRHATASFSFHGSRMRMTSVSDAALKAMNAQRDRCVSELSDADCDILLYACLVAVAAQGSGEHRRTESLVRDLLTVLGSRTKVISSLGALVDALHSLRATRVAMVMPYVPALAQSVVGYFQSEGFTVIDSVALEEPDNAMVARIPGEQVLAAARGLDLTQADALLISACVQMPSLDLIVPAEREFGVPVLSAASAGAYAILRGLGLSPRLPNAGRLLGGW
jgi:maleate isomerase